MANNRQHAVVVGGGIVGNLTAYLLASQGLEVTVIEADALGSHASGFAFGELGDLEGAGIPDPLLDFSVWCNQRHKSLSAELYAASGIDNEFGTVQRVTLAFTDEEKTRLQTHLKWQAGVAEYDTYWMTPDELHVLEPRLSSHCLGGSYISNAKAVEPYRCTLAAAQSAQKLGVETLLRKVTNLLQRGPICEGVEFDGGRIESDLVVLAMGPWTKFASEWCGIDIPITPLKGQMLRLKIKGEPLKSSFHYGSSYAASKSDGLIWAGTTEEKAGFDETATVVARNSIMSDLLQALPFLEDAELNQQTACLRPWSSDGIPIVCRAPGWDNLYICTGGGRKGILWSTGMCHGVVDIILDRKSVVPGLEHLDMSRFSDV